MPLVSILLLLASLFSGTLKADACTNANCTANDVSTAVVNLISGPSVCVNSTTIYVQLQAQTAAGANQRYDIGYFLANDGGDAKTGSCIRDYLPPPLNNTPTVGTTRISPFINLDNDTCGDIEQNKTSIRNLGGPTVSSGTPGPPAIYAIPCRDFNNDFFSDVGVCTSWDNQSDSTNCSSAADAVPATNSKCNCTRLKIGNIIYKAQCSSSSDCDDNNACTADSCNNQTLLCNNTPIGAGTSCNDGNPCTTNDTCGGTNNVICLGTAVVCSPLDQCHDAGVCDYGTGLCTNPIKTNGTSCSDGQTCTGPDTCQSGTCTGADSCGIGQECTGNQCVQLPSCETVSDCNDNNSCTTESCVSGFCHSTNTSSGTSCSDNDLCTTSDICDGAGNCNGTAVVCSALDTCHVAGTCDSQTGLCSNPNAADNTICDDNDLCTSNDVCTSGTCGGTATVCSALDQCHVAGVCNSQTGICTNPDAPNATSCDDGITCTSNDICTNGGCSGLDNCAVGSACIMGECTATPNCSTNADCNDQNQCTTDACISGFCNNTPLNAGTTCDDGDLCTTDDQCGGISSPSCSGTAVICTALDECHDVGICDTMTGTCSSPNKQDGTACDDEVICTSFDECTSGVCAGTDNCPFGQMCSNNQCVLSPNCDDNSDCDDQNVCTADSCNQGFCANMAMTGSSCDDQNACTTDDVCQGSGNPVCQGTVVTCTALDQCHEAGVCDSMSGVCTNPNKSDLSLCNDNDACTLSDVCLNGVCTAGTPVTCNTAGICRINPGTCLDGICSYEPAENGTSCGENSICQGGTCFSVLECLDTSDCPEQECLTASCVINVCTYFAAPINEGASCGDGVCHSGACVQCLEGVDCVGINECVNSVCTPNNDCTYMPALCSGGDQCNEPSCDIEEGCTTNPLTGTPCNDSLLCTINDTCNNGQCVGTGVVCVPPDTCSTASCNQVNGQCVVTGCMPPTFCDNASPSGRCVQCDEGSPCPVNLICDDGTCVGCVLDRDCDVADHCIKESCIDHECVYSFKDNCRADHSDNIEEEDCPPYLPLPMPIVEVPPSPISVPVDSNTVSFGSDIEEKSTDKSSKGSSCSGHETNALVLWAVLLLGLIQKVRRILS